MNGYEMAMVLQIPIVHGCQCEGYYQLFDKILMYVMFYEAEFSLKLIHEILRCYGMTGDKWLA